ncbi:DUF6101 family protein [Labrys wisconsinensis]|uniref:Uncharacterized protein n=1 Tax=Labrys wisconsinensis TaxID=425677 RepID=A0ABU0JAZ1_9HYPH|nr:DUF6101 family protein [Labrys wisconsinensis]MDQ0470444.1 hypothetical protein [Labrys wisconsinensis]
MAAPDRPSRSGALAVPIRFEVEDPRADGGRRHIEILEHAVQIERSRAGVRMRVAIPYPLYEGVALEVRPTAAHGARVLVRLVHEDRDLDVVLFEASDDHDVAAEWQYWANRFCLPMLVAELDGSFSEPFPRLGALAIGRVRPRRMPSHIARRRPRFLTRRRTGRLPKHPKVHREREIIART